MKTITCLLFLFMAFSSQAQKYSPSQSNLEARQAFSDDKFGLFIHWGVYSTLGDAEWVMNNQKITVDRYEKLPYFFYPIEFDAKEWVSIAKAAGMKYITITTKHHDGFAMYDSQVSDYNIVDATPYGRDIFRELEQECKKQGIKLYAYYSQLDWHHPDYYPRGWTGRNTGRPLSGNWDDYLKYQNAQIKEIAENYDISGFWFDGWWDQQARNPSFTKSEWWIPKDQIDWKLRETYDMIHSVNSALLIGNNHHVAPFEGEDFQMFEKDLPGKNTTGFGSSEEDIGALPLESCQTINHSWGFNLQDGSNKSIKELIQFLVQSAGFNANLLLNVGPMPSGKIQPDHIDLLKQMGSWLKENGETIYGSRQGPLPPQSWGVTTKKGDKVYLHIIDENEQIYTIPGIFSEDIASLTYFGTSKKVKTEPYSKGIIITIDDANRKAYDTILELKLK